MKKLFLFLLITALAACYKPPTEFPVEVKDEKVYDTIAPTDKPIDSLHLYNY